MKQIFFALMALCFVSVAHASPKPPNVPTPVLVTPTYSTTATHNLPIDASGTPPTYTGLTNIAGSGTYVIPSVGDATNYCTISVSCPEAKFRTHVDFSHMLPDDPIRNYGQPGTSHLHCFFGSGSTNAYSTYKTLRQHAKNSKALGVDTNATGYWFPCVTLINPYGNGKNYALKMNYATVYYIGDTVFGQRATPLVPGISYVFGFDMDSASPATQYAWLQTVLDAKNATVGYTRYYIREPVSQRFWTQPWFTCQGATPNVVDYIVNADGSDPHAGTCASGADYWAQLQGPDCWDGKNPWSDGGYRHVIPRVWDQDYSEWICPTNYYALPSLNIQFHFTQYGWTDRQRWALASDISYRAAKGLTSAQVPSGMTFHTDWMHGWDQVQMLKWQRQCTGVEHNTPHQCNSSQISSTEALAGPIDLSSIAHVNESDAGWMRIPTAWTGSLTGLHIHH